MPDTPLGPGGSQTTPKQAKKGLKQITSGNPNAGNPASPNVQSSPTSPCLVSFPSASVPLVGSVGGGCLLSKTAVRAMVGGLLIGLGGTLFIVGGVVLAAAGFRKTGGLEKAAQVASVIPGGQVAAAGLRTAGRQGYTSGGIAAVGEGQRQRKIKAREEQRKMKALGEPRENENLREGKGAIRETKTETRRRRETGKETARRMASASSNGGGDRAPF